MARLWIWMDKEILIKQSSLSATNPDDSALAIPLVMEVPSIDAQPSRDTCNSSFTRWAQVRRIFD